MANIFKSFATHNIGTGNTVLRTVPGATTDVIIGVRLTNLLSTDITAQLQVIKNAGATVNILAPNTLIPAGSAISALTPNEKVVLEAGDIIQGLCSAANGMDSFISAMEQT